MLAVDQWEVDLVLRVGGDEATLIVFARVIGVLDYRLILRIQVYLLIDVNVVSQDMVLLVL